MTSSSGGASFLRRRAIELRAASEGGAPLYPASLSVPPRVELSAVSFFMAKVGWLTAHGSWSAGARFREWAVVGM